MTADQYVALVVDKYAVSNATGSLAHKAAVALVPTIREWADRYLLGITFAGSYAKGTAISLGTDVDLFISVSQVPGAAMKDIYWSLFNHFAERQFHPEAQNVSVRVKSMGLNVDLVPGRKQQGNTTDHTLYRRKADTWTQTNVQHHVKLVSTSGRTNEIRALKIWRQRNGLDFPSFYLELTVLEALKGRRVGALASNVWATFEYLRDSLTSVVAIDPANTNNTVSDDLSLSGKQDIAKTASQSLKASNWEQIIW